MSIARRYAKPIAVGLIVAGYLFAAYLFFVSAPLYGTFGFDAFAYWSVTMPDPYGIPYGSLGSYNYSPAFAQIADFFGSVDLWVYLWLWTCLLIGSVIYLAGSPGWILVAFGIPFVALELYHGNIHILLAVAIVLGFRHPWTWAFVLLTKPSCGIGLLWFVVRREWRQLGIALGATAIVVAISFVLAPSAWFGWVELLVDGVGGAPASNNFAIPLWIRLPLAAALVVWGALTDRRWTVVVSSMLALPVLWFAAPAMLIGVLPDVRENMRKRQTAELAEAEEPAGNDEPA